MTKNPKIDLDPSKRTFTLAPRLRPKNASYAPGEPIRGDRLILVDGVMWGFVQMIGHGCHGPSYEFHDARGCAIPYIDDRGKVWHSQTESVHPSRNKRRAWDENEPKPPSAEEAILTKARSLYAVGRLRDPAELAREAAEHTARTARIEAQIKEERDTMRSGLIALWARKDLTNVERVALSQAFKDIFHGPIEKAHADAIELGEA